jgi:hypothetical protein
MGCLARISAMAVIQQGLRRDRIKLTAINAKFRELLWQTNTPI